MPSSADDVPIRRSAAAASSPAARAAAAVIGLQALLIAVLSLILAVSGFQPDTVDRAGAEILALIGLVSAVALTGLARGVLTRRSWARSPALVLELICLPVAVTVVQNGRWYAGIPLGISAVAVLALLAASGQLTRNED